MAYEIVLTDRAATKLSGIRTFDRTKIRDAIELHLRYVGLIRQAYSRNKSGRNGRAR
jgi:hypothetical protein